MIGRRVISEAEQYVACVLHVRRAYVVCMLHVCCVRLGMHVAFTACMLHVWCLTHRWSPSDANLAYAVVRKKGPARRVHGVRSANVSGLAARV